MSSAVVLGLTGASAVVAAGAGWATATPAGARPLGDRPPPGRMAGPTIAMGAALLRVARVPSADQALCRTVGRTALLGLVLLPAFPPAAVGAVGVAWLRRRLGRLRASAAAARAVAGALPEVVDLLLLCCGAGLALPLALPVVADHVAPPLGRPLRAADRAAAHGTPRADALVAELGPLGDRATALAHVLADHLHYGVALAPALERLGLELRLDRRRRAEQDARRVPIRLLAPLVTCVLPAFGLLTVVPLLVSSLGALPT